MYGKFDCPNDNCVRWKHGDVQANGRKLRSANSACLFGHRAPIDQPARPRYKLGRCQHNIISWKDLTMIIRPFEALRSTPDSAAAVASVPYDVVDTTEARRLAEGNPASFLHVLRSEIDLPEGTDPYSDAAYDKARENLQMLISTGQMVREDEPSLYAYRMTVEGQAQVGLLAGCSIDEYESGLIKKHELTRRDKEDDRTRHMLALSAQPGPVLVAYKDAPVIDEMLADVVEAPPLLACDSETGVRHEVWRIADPDRVVAAFAKVPCAYIADGHYEPFGLVPIVAGNSGVQMAGWFNKEISSVDDLRGLKMRIPGLGGEVLARAGGVPVVLPGSEVFTAMQTGVIDATEWVGPYNDLAFGLHTVARYYYYPGWHEPGATIELIVNKAALETLPVDLQLMVQTAARAVNDDLLSEFTARNSSALKTLVEEHGVELRRLPDEVLEALKVASREVVAESARNNELAGRIYDSYMAFLEDVSAYHAITEQAYVDSR